jgi:hypothetical protein
MVCDTDGSKNVFASLADARRFCQAIRKDSGNERIFVYALVGVEDALLHWPERFEQGA